MVREKTKKYINMQLSCMAWNCNNCANTVDLVQVWHGRYSLIYNCYHCNAYIKEGKDGSVETTPNHINSEVEDFVKNNKK